MEKVFGLPATELALGMTALLAFIFLLIGIGASRRFILVKMGSRNIPRRKGQSALIVIGLMLSTAIIATSLGIGDTVRYSVRSVALDFLGPTDEIIKGPGRQTTGEEYFDFAQFQNIEQVTRDNKNIEALLPLIEINLPASNDVLELAESNMRVRGVHGEYSDNYDELQNLAGQTVFIKSLLENEIYINADSSEILKLQKGDKVSVYTRSGKFEFSVRDVLKNGGLAGGGRNPYILFSLDELQELIGKQGQITNVYVSNSGEGEDALKLSEDVTKFLRSELTNTDVATKMFGILQGNAIPEILLEESDSISQTDKETSKTLDQLYGHLASNDFGDGFIKGISDYQNQLTILGILDKSGLKEDAGKIAALSPALTTLRVDDQKSDSVRLAETVATGVTTIFSIFGSFSIMVGMLLIFLVFVLLAAARSTELGMARAVGLKRRDLVQLFTYEGTIYAFLAAIIGTVVGVGLSFGLVFILQDLIDTDGFVITPYYSVVSLLISFSSGLILTFITVVFSAYRASNLNIVVAIRGLKDEFVKKAPDPIGKKVKNFVWNLIFPVKQLVWIIRGNGGRMGNFSLLLLFPVVWPINILTSLFNLSGKHNYLVPGIFSLFLLVSGILTETGASLSIGLIGSALTVGLFARYLCSKFINNTETGNQIAGSLEGGLVLISNSLPFDFFSRWLPELSEPGPWFWPVGGAISTAAAVWLLMSNTRILIALLNLILSRFSGLKAVTKTAISYPMAAKFRTGLTVAMFALIIFTLMIFSVLNGIQDVATEQPERVTGGYDIKATITPDLPITGDIRNSLNMSEFEVIAGASNLRVEVKESEGKNNTYKGARLVSLENEFLDSTLWKMAHFDPSYGATDREIWQALMNDETLILANATIIPSGDPFGPPDRSFKSSFIESGDLKPIDSFSIEMKKRRSSSDPTQLTVIGVIERLASGTGFGGGSATFYSPRALASKIAQENVPLDTFYFSLKDKSEASNYSQKLEKIYLANGMNAVSLLDRLEEERATSNAFNKLFQGFSGLGLVVGVAAIGVLSVRAVVERRQSIGVLRAIGFRSSMIRTQFLIESSFITILGIFVGICLGILQSWLIFLEISKELEGAKFSVPIGEVGVLIGITIIASILASVIPANEASKTYPAEALRYE
ncbi:MAG: ABC-type antimicrobial peptide transport system [Chloroflexi bacterium]|jgi:putative ABC transport system permease protein|nr:MAG: ABC-type antimicrobial peptide transport system [Chloroflexota bacterium]